MSKILDWEDTYENVKFEVFLDPVSDLYDCWLYLKQGKTLVFKDKDCSVYGPKNYVFDAIDKAIREKKV